MSGGNPALQLDHFQSEAETYNGPSVMTVGGAVQKSLILSVLLIAAAAVGWILCSPQASSAIATQGQKMFVMFGSAITAFIVAMVITFKQKLAPFLAPVYAILEGVFIGGISSFYADRFHNIVPLAGMLTIGVMVVMLLAYTSRVIRATPALTKGIIAATGAVFLVYMVSIVLSLFGVQVPYIHSSGPIGIGFSVVVVGIAAFNLILDFDLIETGSRMRAPKYMEWYAAFGLMVTLVWLYLEILRLLAKLRSND
jgi:uncharacterized YccA/Bax inhibitor family protein